MEEPLLVLKCKKGKSSAQFMVYQRYSPILRGVCRRYISDMNEAEDVLQEGFIKIFLNIKKFNYQGKGSFLSWMKRIMINQALNHIKKNSKKIFDESLEDKHHLITAGNDDDFFNVANARFSKEDVIKAVNTLPVPFKTVLNMAIMDGMRHKEISDFLGIAEETSRSRLTRAKQMLKKHLLEVSNKRNTCKIESTI